MVGARAWYRRTRAYREPNRQTPVNNNNGRQGRGASGRIGQAMPESGQTDQENTLAGSVVKAGGVAG